MEDGPPPTLRVQNLSLRRGDRLVLDDITLEADTGLLVLAGPNGAGKSSLIRTLASLYPPSSGSVFIAGNSLSDRRQLRRARSWIGYLPQDASFPGHFTAIDAVEYAAWLAKVARGHRRKAARAALGAFGATHLADRRIGQMSVGERQTVYLAQATVHEPRLLLLDEPSSSVDSSHRARLRHLLRAWSRSRLVVLATHLVEEVELLGDRVVVLDRGLVLFDGSARGLEELAPPNQAIGDERPIETALRFLTESHSCTPRPDLQAE